MNTRTPDQRPDRRPYDIRRLLTSGRWSRPARLTGAVAVLATCAFVVAGSPVSAAPATHAKPHGKPKLAPPPQMSALDPLLGKYKCDEAAAPDQEFYLNTTRAMGGHFQYGDITIQPGDLHAMAAYGWDPVNGNYFSQYHDNWGSHSTTTSPGWKDGHLIFTGEIVQVAAPDATGHAQGALLKLKDDYSIVRPGYFKSVTTVTYNGVDYPHSYDCHRIG